MGWGGESPVPLSHENTRLAGGLIRRMKMARGSCLAGKIKAGILGLAVLGGMALPAHAGDPPKLALSGAAWLTTDYMFRSISNTSQNPAAQVEFDATYGIFYGYVWGSNTDFGENIELDYGLGITPKWGPITFNFAGLYYTYPGANDESTTSRRWAARAGPAARGPLASRTIGRRIISSFLASLMRSRAPLRTPGPTSCGTSSRPASAAPSASSRTRKMPTTTCTGTPA